MSGWERTHRRYRLVYAVADDIARRGNRAAARWEPAINEEFGGVEQFLLDVKRRWLTAVAAFSDYAMEPETEADRHNAGLRALLDAYAEHPALSAPQRQTA